MNKSENIGKDKNQFFLSKSKGRAPPRLLGVLCRFITNLKKLEPVRFVSKDDNTSTI